MIDVDDPMIVVARRCLSTGCEGAGGPSLNEWTWWGICWAVPLVVGVVIIKGDRTAGSGLLWLAGALFFVGGLFATMYDAVTPCDRAELTESGDGGLVCVTPYGDWEP